MRHFLLAFFLSFLTLPAFSEESPLRVGMELGYPPFEMVGADGEPCGISVDMAHALGKYLDRPIIIENISFVGLIPALKSGKIDIIISSMTSTEERKKSIDFSEPYAMTGLCMLVNAKSPLQSVTDANNPDITVAVKAGTSGEIYASKNLSQAVVWVLDQEAMCVLEVIQGKADGFIYDQLSVYTHWQKNKGTTRALLKPFQKEYWAVGLRKGNDELREKINAFIRAFKVGGGFDKLADTYLPQQKAAFKQMGIPFLI